MPAKSSPSLEFRGLSRRRALAVFLLAMPAMWPGVRAQTSAIRPTPAQTEGPFYPVVLPADTDYDLLRNGDLIYPDGQAVRLEGVVSDLAGKPLAGVQVEIWQCDNAGHYHHPGDGGKADPRFQGFGRATTDAEGRYRFRTIRPVAYGGRAPHIHVKVKQGARELLTSQIYVAGEPRNMSDFLWRRMDAADRAALTVDFVPDRDGAHAVFPIVIAA